MLIIYTKFLCLCEALVVTHYSTIHPSWRYCVSVFASCNTAQPQRTIFLKLGIKREKLALLTSYSAQVSCFTYAHAVDITRVGCRNFKQALKQFRYREQLST